MFYPTKDMNAQHKSLQDQLHDYIEGYSVMKGFSQRTIQNKRDFFKRFLAFLGGRDFTIETTREYCLFLARSGCTPNTINTCTRMLRAFSNWQQENGYAESFALKIEQPKLTQKEIPYLEPELIEEIILAGTEPKPFIPRVGGDNKKNAYYKLEARICLFFILRTGLRIFEVLSLKGSDLRLDEEIPSYWVNRKGGRREILPLPVDMIEELRKRKDQDRLFNTSAELCNLALKRGAKEKGITIELTCHTLRHIFASYLVKNSKPIQQVKRLMGHSNITTTDKLYTHLNLKDVSSVLNSNAIIRHGLPVKEVLNDVSKSVQEKVKNDDRFLIRESAMNETEDEVEIILRIVAKKV